MRKITAAELKKTQGVNKLEQKYAEHLQKLKLIGEIRNWNAQPTKLILAYRTTYTPDFRVLMNDDSIEYHETKGFMRDDAAVKLKVAAMLYPQFVFRLVKWDNKKGWNIKQVPSRLDGTLESK